MTDQPYDRAIGDDRGNPDDSLGHDLLLRLQRGDESALEALYDRYAGIVYTLALRIVGDRDLAEEVLQDAFLRCWDGAARYDPARGRVVTWLMSITRNRAIDLLRGRQHHARTRERSSLMLERDVADASDQTHAVLLRQIVGGALRELAPRQREALVLAYYGGLTQREIAERLGTPLGTVKSQMRSGLDQLRSLLGSTAETLGEEREHRA